MEKSSLDATMVGVQKDVLYIKEAISRVELRLERDYVTREEFNPVRTIVYGMVGIVLTAVLVTLVALVVKGKI